MTAWSNEVEDAAYGAFIGCAVGNAVGTMLPIYTENSQEQVDAALQWRTRSRRAAGQISCDAEMAIVMAQALAEAPAGSLPVTGLIDWYLKWTHASPSEYGSTLRSALNIMERSRSKGPKAVLSDVANPEINRRASLQSNGSLMRALPLGIWGYTLTVDDVAACAKAESSLTHPSAACCDAVATYTVAVAHLVRHAGDREGALAAATAWADANACPDVQSWLLEAKGRKNADRECLNNIEWVRWPFQAAFMHLASGIGYLDGLKATLAAGGDPCTNSCVVGGMLGALHGAKAVPPRLIEDVLGCRVGTRGIVRADFMQSGIIPDLTRRLLTSAHGRKIQNENAASRAVGCCGL